MFVKKVLIMDKFKLKPGLQPSYDITTSGYESKTNRSYPYCQRDKQGVLHYYAVCPECNNPIVIVSLYKNADNSPKPYGRHIKKNIPGVAYYSQEAYDSCPYANPKWKQNDKLPDASHAGVAKLRFIKKHFDLIMHILREETGIRFSAKLSEYLLQNYLDNQGWRYRYSTVSNLPWTLPLSSQAITLKGRYLDRDSNLFKSLSSKYPDMLDDNRIKFKSNPYNPKFVFLNYQQVLTQNKHHLTESVDFKVINQSKKATSTLYNETLNIDRNLLVKSTLLSTKKIHSKTRLDIANKLICQSS